MGQTFIAIIMLLIGVALGGALVWLLLKTRITAAYERGRSDSAVAEAALAQKVVAREETIEELRSHLSEKDALLTDLQRQLNALTGQAATLKEALEAEKKQAQEKIALLTDAKQQLTNVFQALASEVLKSNSTSFLELAKTQLEKYQESAKGDLEKRQSAIDELLRPVKETLGKVETKLQEIEKSRIEAYSSLREQVRSLSEAQKELRGETANLVRALRRPQTRGRWGEFQLRRVVEMAGMLNYCDFIEQPAYGTEEGRLRPDMIIRLPGGRTIVVDAKTPLEAYLEAAEAENEELRAAKLKEHARQVREHISNLARKSYFEQANSPDFVVMFLPGEVFYMAALEQDPSLLEAGINERVLLAGPTSLIALLRAAAYGWREEQLAENAKIISNLGRDLHRRLATLSEHFAALRNALEKAVEAFNKAVGSLETNVLRVARRFKELGAADNEIEELSPVETEPRALQAPELAGPGNNNR